MSQVNEFRGFSLFNDVEDDVLRTYNRARILVNMMEDHQGIDPDGNKGVKAVGAVLIMGYFMQIPPEERAAVRAEAEVILNKRGELNGK